MVLADFLYLCMFMDGCGCCWEWSCIIRWRIAREIFSTREMSRKTTIIVKTTSKINNQAMSAIFAKLHEKLTTQMTSTTVSDRLVVTSCWYLRSRRRARNRSIVMAVTVSSEPVITTLPIRWNKVKLFLTKTSCLSTRQSNCNNKLAAPLNQLPSQRQPSKGLKCTTEFVKKLSLQKSKEPKS